MRRGLGIAFLLVLSVSAVVYSRVSGGRESGTFDTEPATPYFHYLPVGESRGVVLVVHGLSSSKSIMALLCYALVDAGLEVYAIDLPGHGASAASFNALQARTVVDNILTRLGPDTAVLGHSLGGALLLDVASDRPIPRMVLLSPAPTPLGRLQAGRLLVVEGQFDPGRIRAFVPQIHQVAEGTFEFRDLAWTGHSGALFKPAELGRIAAWLGGDTSRIHTAQRLVLLSLMGVSSLGLGVALLKDSNRQMTPDRWSGSSGASTPTLVLRSYVLAAIIGAFVLWLVPAGGWLRLYPVDYLMGLLLLAGILVLLRVRSVDNGLGSVVIPVAAVAYVVAVPGFLVANHVLDLSLSGGRWWRFAGVVLLSLPLFLADEALIRPLRPWWRAAAVATVSRVVLAAVAVSSALLVDREASFLLLVTHLILVFWAALWIAGELIWRRTGTLGAVLFAALVQGWVFAAVFVTR